MDNDDQVRAVNRVYDYINENLNNKMTLYEIANISGYSPWYISKIPV